MFGWFTFVEVTSRFACCLIVNITCTNRGSCPRDPPSMIAYTLCRPLLRPLTVWSPHFDLNHFCFHYVWFYGFSSLVTFPYICIYSYFKCCCFVVLPPCVTLANMYLSNDIRYTVCWYANIAKCKNGLIWAIYRPTIKRNYSKKVTVICSSWL